MKAWAILCGCEAGCDQWLSRAERPAEAGAVAFPILGAYDYQSLETDNRVTFESRIIANTLRLLLPAPHDQKDHVVEVEIGRGQVPGRLVGR